MPESPRWLISKERYDEAYAVLKKMAEVNGKELPSDLMNKLKSIKSDHEIQRIRRESRISERKLSDHISESVPMNDIKDTKNETARRYSISIPADDIDKSFGNIVDIIKLPGLRKKFLILTLGWISCSAVYNGLTLSFENFHGNEFVNWFLLSVVEFPSNWTAVYLMETR